MEKAIILMWSYIPENLEVYVIPEDQIPPGAKIDLHRVHGMTVNVDEFTEEEMASYNKLTAYAERPDTPDEHKQPANIDENHRGMWHKFKISSDDDSFCSDLPQEYAVSHIYSLGFYM